MWHMEVNSAVDNQHLWGELNEITNTYKKPLASLVISECSGRSRGPDNYKAFNFRYQNYTDEYRLIIHFHW